MTQAAQERVYDVVGVGFGPSNLALAVAVAEHNAVAEPADRITARFLERQPGFGWHRGMLIDDATMQVSFLKDLVTLRDPTSRFSFLSYLHSRGRLVDFVNHKNLFPLRVEFHDYFEWAAGQVGDLVSYGREAVAVRVAAGGEADGQVEVEARHRAGADRRELLRARNLVLATGLRPRLPDGISASARIWHNSELLHRIGAVDQNRAARFVVLGAGQSAAEVTAFLHTRFPRAEVCAVFSRYGYSPADDSPFANRIFDPAAVDDFYAAPEEVKAALMRYHGNTNYSVVDVDLIEDLYRRVYREKVSGARRLRVFNVSRPAELVETGDGVRVTVEDLVSGEHTVLRADVVVCATGYRPDDPLSLLGEVGERCRRDRQGRVEVDRDYRLRTSAPLRSGIYLQGRATEHSHGITSSLLSNGAVRAGEILRSILDRRAEPVRSPRPVTQKPATV